MKKIKALIFDLDGTLIDTLADLSCSVNAVLQRHDLPLHSLEEYQTFIGQGSKVLIEKALGIDNLELFDTVYKEYIEQYSANVNIFSHPYSHMRTLLHRLKDAGYKVFVLTNKPQSLSEKLLRLSFPDFAFDKIVGQSPTVKPKPDLSGLESILFEYELASEEIMFVGDSDVDLMTASLGRAGASVHVTYGYRSSEEVALYQPDYSVSDPFEIIEILHRIGKGKRYPDFQFFTLSVVGFAVAMALTGLMAYFYRGSYLSSWALVLLTVTAGFSVVFYLVTLSLRLRLNRHLYIYLLSLFMGLASLLLHIGKVVLHDSDFLSAVPLIFLGVAVVFMVVNLVVGLRMIVIIFRSISSITKRRRFKKLYKNLVFSKCNQTNRKSY